MPSGRLQSSGRLISSVITMNGLGCWQRAAQGSGNQGVIPEGVAPGGGSEAVLFPDTVEALCSLISGHGHLWAVSDTNPYHSVH